MKVLARESSELDSAVGRLFDEMGERWRTGECPDAEAFLNRQPELWRCPEAALELIAEEIALREEYGHPIASSELMRRFPQWSIQVQALCECQKVFGARPGAMSFPQVGDSLGEFHLIAELGRGANGRVFLASQVSLGDRLVVLKVSPAEGCEHLSLARLQHTHIVPLYSAHEFFETGLRGLCLPFFGGTTLAALISGGQVSSSFPAGPERADAVCRIGISLADALQYAHERGLLHLDLKPSNILIAADGTPMLLDFHLARPPLNAGAPAPGWLGGTAKYMAPELESAVKSVRNGQRIPDDIDVRADIFSLGVLLQEALGGHRGSVGLVDMLDRCTSPNPGDRYSTAAHLAADLRRHLANQPLNGVSNRSLAERWTKWRRRKPYTLPALLMMTALAIAAGILTSQAKQQFDRAEESLHEGETHLRHGRHLEAIDTFRNGEALINGVPFERSLGRKLREACRSAERGQAAADLHAFCDRIRPIYAAESLSSEQVRIAESRCRAIWTAREAIVSQLSGQSETELDRQWRTDLLDVGTIYAHLQPFSTPLDQPVAHRKALAILDEAEQFLGPSSVLFWERLVHARALGLTAMQAESLRLAEACATNTAWEQLIVGRSSLGTGDLPRALAELNRCLERDPGSLWANYYRGVCLMRLKQPADAVEAFSVCVALSPRSGWCLYNRGLALSQAGRHDRAHVDFDRALGLDPSLPTR